jgi:RimJ/RimL family protein N-acetyltransferase
MFAVHGDPLTNLHNPAGPDADVEASARRLRSFMDDWTSFGIGYWTVVLKSDGEVIGFAGLRKMEWHARDILNLYYRFKPAAWGYGFATEVAMTAVTVVGKHFPDIPVVVRIRPSNEAAITVARKIGLHRRPALESEHMVFVSQW